MKHWPFIATILLIVIVVGGLIWQQEQILQTGETVILETRPVDPRDLFRGEYVVLRYAIENQATLPSSVATTELRSTQPVYVRLITDNRGVASVAETQLNPPTTEGLWLQGELSGRWIRFRDLEQFYLPEGTGRTIERMGSDLHVEVVLKDGVGRVVRLLDENLEPVTPE